MDQASYHKSVEMKKIFAKLGFCVLYNAPATPELNSCEDFIRDVKSKIHKLRAKTL